jgi:hypothetical protein
MKKLFLLGAFALLSSTIFSCTADDVQTDNKTTETTEAKKSINPAVVGTEQTNADDGPGDQPVIISPPK